MPPFYVDLLGFSNTRLGDFFGAVLGTLRSLVALASRLFEFGRRFSTLFAWLLVAFFVVRG
jgi:hypothetical protein